MRQIDRILIGTLVVGVWSLVVLLTAVEIILRIVGD